jgi:hypothetical protein
MKNATALLTGVIIYALFATLFGMMSLGVGFMPDRSRTIYGYIILLAPLIQPVSRSAIWRNLVIWLWVLRSRLLRWPSFSRLLPVRCRSF